MSDESDSSRAGERHPAFKPKPGSSTEDPDQSVVQWLRDTIGVRAHCISGTGWVRALLATDGPEALARVLDQISELHDLALASEKWWRDGKGVLRCEVRADIGAALDCLRMIAQLSALKNDGDEQARKAAAMTPEERAAAILKDPVHAPILRRMIAEEKKR